MSGSSRSFTVDRGVRQDDVAMLVSAILSDDSMNLPMVPDAVERVIYHSTIKLTFNMFYKAISNLHGMGIVASSSSTTRSSSGKRELQLERVYMDRSFLRDLGEQQQQQQWRAFQTKIDLQPIEDLASSLLQNKAVNLTVVPDTVEKQIYINCLKIIFWVLNLISSNVKIIFCGHTISMDLMPVSSSIMADFGARKQGAGSDSGGGIISRIDSFLVNPQTIQDFSHQANSLLCMDGNNPLESNDSGSGSRGGGGGAVKSGLAWMRSSLNKVHQEMIQKVNTSLYGLILAIVDDLLKCTKIEILSDQISLRVAASQQTQQPPPSSTVTPTSNTSSAISNGKDNSRRQSHLNGCGAVDDISWAVQASLESLGFEEERALLQRRMQDWSPEERALILKDLSRQG